MCIRDSPTVIQAIYEAVGRMGFETGNILEPSMGCLLYTSQFHEKVMERQAHQQEREQAFLSQNRDCFAIYQVKHTDELRDIRYEGMDWLRSIGQAVKRENYDLVYTCLLYTSRCV